MSFHKDKGESIWDVLIHEKPDVVWGKANADVAANSYYLYKTDVDLVEKIGVNLIIFINVNNSQ